MSAPPAMSKLEARRDLTSHPPGIRAGIIFESSKISLVLNRYRATTTLAL